MVVVDSGAEADDLTLTSPMFGSIGDDAATGPSTLAMKGLAPMSDASTRVKEVVATSSPFPHEARINAAHTRVERAPTAERRRIGELFDGAAANAARSRGDAMVDNFLLDLQFHRRRRRRTETTEVIRHHVEIAAEQAVPEVPLDCARAGCQDRTDDNRCTRAVLHQLSSSGGSP